MLIPAITLIRSDLCVDPLFTVTINPIIHYPNNVV